jgi:hypothetical protein
VAERLNAAVLKCLQLTSISPRKYHLSTLSRTINPYRGLPWPNLVRKSVRRIAFLTGAACAPNGAVIKPRAHTDVTPRATRIAY